MTAARKTGRITYALAQLSERERWLLLILGVIVTPVALAFLLVMPLLEARNTARGQAAEAQVLLNWVSDQVRALPAEGAVITTKFGGNGDPIGISEIEDSLVRANLRDNVSGLSNRTEGGVDLTLEGAVFADLGTWLVAMTPLWGYQIAAFRIETVTPGIVNASFELEAAQ